MSQGDEADRLLKHSPCERRLQDWGLFGLEKGQLHEGYKSSPPVPTGWLLRRPGQVLHTGAWWQDYWFSFFSSKLLFPFLIIFIKWQRKLKKFYSEQTQKQRITEKGSLCRRSSGGYRNKGEVWFVGRREIIHGDIYITMRFPSKLKVWILLRLANLKPFVCNH